MRTNSEWQLHYEHAAGPSTPADKAPTRPPYATPCAEPDPPYGSSLT
ncbi:hypothetical protein GCM10010348_76530 [Streptomyces anthocyanicus]|nr:hypothetical protein GCM10010348_76530 [Streptomyces anthocyanicus]